MNEAKQAQDDGRITVVTLRTCKRGGKELPPGTEVRIDPQEMHAFPGLFADPAELLAQEQAQQAEQSRELNADREDKLRRQEADRIRREQAAARNLKMVQEQELLAKAALVRQKKNAAQQG